MTKEQAAKIVLYQDEMSSILGIEVFNTLKEESAFQSSNSELIRTIAIDMSLNPENWNGLGYLNSVKREHWDSSLYCDRGTMAGSPEPVPARIPFGSSRFTLPGEDVLCLSGVFIALVKQQSMRPRCMKTHSTSGFHCYSIIN